MLRKRKRISSTHQELRAAISLALFRDQGKVQQARELLAPLLEELAC
jgi:hypothetical protein